MEGMTSTWITNLHRSCVEFGIFIGGGWCAPLQRVKDVHIATAFTNHFTNIPAKDIRLFRECFRHMNVTTLADITNGAGTHIASGIHELRFPAYPSKFHFHLQPITITGKHRDLWNEFLAEITISHTHQLINPLGPWLTTPSTHRPYRLADGSLYTQHENEQWYRHQLLAPVSAFWVVIMVPLSVQKNST